jgi:hypothetical protein
MKSGSEVRKIPIIKHLPATIVVNVAELALLFHQDV